MLSLFRSRLSVSGRTSGIGWPIPARLIAQLAFGRRGFFVHLQQCCAIETLMRPVSVIPIRIANHFLSHPDFCHRHPNMLDVFVFHRPDEPLDQGDASMPSDGAEARRNPFSFAPSLEGRVPELYALVADEVFGLCPGSVQHTYLHLAPFRKGAFRSVAIASYYTPPFPFCCLTLPISVSTPSRTCWKDDRYGHPYRLHPAGAAGTGDLRF